MKKSTVAYAGTVSVLGMAAGIYGCYVFFSTLSARDPAEVLTLVLLLLLCRCLPLEIREGCAVEMSFIGVLTIFLLEGPETAAALYLLTTPLVVRPASGNPNKLMHIFNTPLIKTAFNAGNVMITIALSGMCFKALSVEIGSTQLPGVLLPVFLYVVIAMLVNSLLMAILLKLEAGVPVVQTMLGGLGQFLPNIVCAAPLGYFFAYLMQQNSGPYLTLLFLLPLLLARFSFKMLLDTKRQHYKVVKALTAAIEAKDPYTVGHSKRVESYSGLIAQKMHFSPRRVETIKTAALFHDIGKIGIGDTILNKPDRLTNEEYGEIKKHPDISVHILEDIDFYGDIRDIIRCHHERPDGRGYPDGCAGKDIPVAAKILAVADSYDAMTSDRPYRRGFSSEKAIEIIKQESGKQFDPDVVAVMVKLYDAGALNNVAADR